MGEIRRTLRRQNLRPTAILRSMQLTHSLCLLPVFSLLGGESDMSLTHDGTIMLRGPCTHTAPPAVEAHMRTAPMRRRCGIDIGHVDVTKICD
jgi:hypothetical protein